MNIDERQKLITLAGIIAFGGNLLLAGLKIVAGSITGSLAVIGDGIDSSTDVIIACMTLVISRIISRPSDKDHPWGHGRAETTATMVLSFLIFFAGAQLGVSAVKQLFSGEVSPAPDMLAIIVTAVSVVGKGILAFTQFRLGKKAASSMVLANAQNMRNDIVISFSVLAGLAAARIFGMPILDAITAAAVSLWVMKNAVTIFMEMNTELMDGNPDNTMYAELFASILAVDGVRNPHRARIRKIASRWDIDVDIEVDAELTVHQAHDIAEKVEKSVRRTIPDVYDIVVHVEPYGHRKHHPREQYGLSQKDID
ncbi:MAG: cation diffusion facilitator family transporter [Spirochaetaceae bacterium]|jgi:cation diffusion facilitator family transporter|nr:cation diffusion facilitator family transporter [Spirochaetaceae bacterium]